MSTLRIHVLAAPPTDDYAHVEFILDGMSLGVERVTAAALIAITNSLDAPTVLVGKTYEREVG